MTSRDAVVRLDRIYTRGGDAGDTSLGTGTRVPKDDARVEAYGAVDEANAILGLVRLHTQGASAGETDAILARIQNDLFDLGADLCIPSRDGALRIADAQVARLEREIDAVNAALPPLRSFVLPGGTPAAAFLHQARTVTRRAERRTVTLARTEPVNPAALRYLNRLSDLLFVLSRHVNVGADVLWVPGATMT